MCIKFCGINDNNVMRKYCFLRYCSIIILFCYSDIWVFAQKNITIGNDVFFNDLVIPILNEGNTVTFFAKGKSMEPTIKDGEKVCLKKLNDYKIGDVVLAKVFDKRFVLHRIVQLSRDSVFLKGDANQGYEYCFVSNIIAKCISVEHHNESSIFNRKKINIATNTLFIKKQNSRLEKKGGKCFLYTTNLTGIEELNETAEYLWINTGQYFKPKEMVNLILQEYDVESSTAEHDVFELLQRFYIEGMIDLVTTESE